MRSFDLAKKKWNPGSSSKIVLQKLGFQKKRDLSALSGKLIKKKRTEVNSIIFLYVFFNAPPGIAARKKHARGEFRIGPVKHNQDAIRQLDMRVGVIKNLFSFFWNSYSWFLSIKRNRNWIPCEPKRNRNWVPCEPYWKLRQKIIKKKSLFLHRALSMALRHSYGSSGAHLLYGPHRSSEARLVR